MQRIGIYGGTFDPIHFGHLRAAEEAREQLRLDEIWFVPCATPPHKRRRRVTPAPHRVAMARLATAGHPAFRVSTVELERGGRSYTIDTLRALQAKLPAVRLTLLLGLDAFREIGTWKDYRDLFALVDLAVWTRAAEHATDPRALIPVAAQRAFCYGPNRTTLVHRSGNTIHLLTVTALDISASDIRQRIQRGRSIRFLVPPAVERYLTREGLYTGSRAA